MRTTIADIAREAGVSKGLVSFALNDRAGVSPVTRERILRIAADLGWHPSSAARALSADRAGAFGLVLAREASTLRNEPFFMELIAGMEGELSQQAIALVMQIVPDLEQEMATHARWHAERRVDGVFIIDRRSDDPRLHLLEELGLPYVVLGGGILPEVSSLTGSDTLQAARDMVSYLVALGHTRIGRVAGRDEFLHTHTRSRALEMATGEFGIEAPVTVTTDYSQEQGAAATRRLVTLPDRPTALLFDNDIMAASALGVARDLGLGVPDDLSLIAWDDSVICQLSHPPLTALTRDILGLGARAARGLAQAMAGEPQVGLIEAHSMLLTRNSTARAPRV